MPRSSSAYPPSESSLVDDSVAHAQSTIRLKEARKEQAQVIVQHRSKMADSAVPRQRDRARLKEFTGALKKAVSAATARYKVYLVTQNCFASDLELILIADASWSDTCSALEFESEQESDVMNRITQTVRIYHIL